MKIESIAWCIYFSLLAIVVGAFIFSAADSKPTHHVYDNPGGSVFQHMSEYRQLADEGYKLEIHGVCASACTLFIEMFEPEDVCANDDVIFGFHGVSSMFGYNHTMTEFIFPMVYPEELIEILFDEGFTYETGVDAKQHPGGMIWLSPEEINIQSC